MTTEFFKECLSIMNRIKKARNYHVLYFLYNAPFHQLVKLSNITLQFLPPNMTAVAKPLDQFIIKAFKLHYCRHLMEIFLGCSEICQSASDFIQLISVLDPIRWLQEAWDDVVSILFPDAFNVAD